MNLELAKVNKKDVREQPTPFIDESKVVDFNKPDEENVIGHLKEISCKCLMKMLFGARSCRFDCLRPTCFLATRVTKWSPLCDKMLHRLI